MSDRNSHFSKQVIGRDKVCQECGTADDLQAHHIIPISLGGVDNPSNGIALCPSCHADRHPNVPRGLFFNGPSGPAIAGRNATTLAAELGCCIRTITRAAKRLGIVRIGSRWALTDEECQAIRDEQQIGEDKRQMEWEIRCREAEGKGEATKFYSTKEAAEYLELSVSAVKYHVHTAANLQPILVGHALVFTQAQLDKFNIMKRDPGRPRKKNPA